MWKVKGLIEEHLFHKPMEKHSLCPSAPSPKAPRHWIINGFTLGSCARSLAVRAPVRAPKEEAPSPLDQHWRCPWIVRTQFSSARPVRAPKEVQCFAIGQSHRTNAALAKWPVKGQSQSAPPFPPPSLNTQPLPHTRQTDDHL